MFSKEGLVRILTAFTVFNAEINFPQGMNNLAGLLLTQMTDEVWKQCFQVNHS